MKIIKELSFSPISIAGPTVRTVGPFWRFFGNTTSTYSNFEMFSPKLIIGTLLESLKPMETFYLKKSKIGRYLLEKKLV